MKSILYEAALAGKTNLEVAKMLAISEQHFYRVLKTEPAFRESLAAGRELATNHVAKRLFDRAVGCRIVEERPMGGGKNEVVKCRRELPPDTDAAIFLLTNRDPNNWKRNADIQVGVQVIAGLPEDVFARARAIAAQRDRAGLKQLKAVKVLEVTPTIESPPGDQNVTTDL
jgi:hypothetical protein